MSTHVSGTFDDTGRDLRVSGQVGAAIRLGLAEIVQRLANSTPLDTQQAVGHIEYELHILREKFRKDREASDGKGQE